jgi:hypothetical protein
MTSRRQKIDMGKRAIEEMRKAEADLARFSEAEKSSRADASAGEEAISEAVNGLGRARADLTYHLCAFLALLGSLEQFLLKGVRGDPDDAFIRGFRKDNAYYAAAIGLRAVDVHTELAQPSVLRRIELVETRGAADKSASSIHYRISQPSDPRFMQSFDTKSKTWTDWTLKADAIALLAPTSAIELCEAALAFYKTTVLPQAQARGTIAIP